MVKDTSSDTAKRFFNSPSWRIFVGHEYSNCKYLFLILIPHFFVAVLEGGTFALILLALSALSGKTVQNLSIPSFLHIKEWLETLTSMELFYFFVLSAVGFQAFRGAISYVALYGTSLLSLRVQIVAQKQVYHQIFRFSFPFVSQYKQGDLLEYVKGPSTFIPSLFSISNQILVSFFMILGLMFVLFWISPVLTMVTMFLFGVFALVQKTLIKKVLYYSELLTKHLFEFSHQTTQSLQGIRPIHIFFRHQYMLNKIAKLLDQIAESSKRAYFWNNMIPTINETVNVLLVGAILIVGSLILVRGSGDILSSLLTYVALTYRLATRLQICMSGIGSLGMYYGSICRLNEILDDRDKEYIPHLDKELTKWNCKIEFCGVSLQYPKAPKTAVHQVSFSILKGTTVAFVGLSGAGKSSILDLILGLHPPSEGEIFIDEYPLRSFSSESWRRRIGVVSQDTFIFNDTIEENIRFGDTNVSQEDIERVTELAGVSDFVKILPDGYQTVIGERGYKLSGGERQRVALARALLRDPEILLLDEATSNLDSCSEQLIQRSLEFMQNSKTIIVVAHRLSTIAKADQIIVLEKGKIIELGKHESLLALNGRYAKLWMLQSDHRTLNEEREKNQVVPKENVLLRSI